MTEDQAKFNAIANRQIPVCRDTVRLCLHLLEMELAKMERERKWMESRGNVEKMMQEFKSRLPHPNNL